MEPSVIYLLLHLYIILIVSTKYVPMLRRHLHTAVPNQLSVGTRFGISIPYSPDLKSNIRSSCQAGS